MSEIQGLGASQNVRPALPALRTSPVRPELPIETPSSFGNDAVQMSGGTSALPPSRPPRAPPPPVRECPPPQGASALVEEVDGFIVAGLPQVPTATSRSTEVSSILAPGPIAVIDENPPEILHFPELSLNGPSTATTGLFSLSGNRLA
jgi:hypothetical protein